jgi:hypothetical protein
MLNNIKTKQFFAFILSIFLMLAISSCTTKVWYQSVKQGAENNCRRQPLRESEQCLESLNNKTYEDYEKERTYQKSP